MLLIAAQRATHAIQQEALGLIDRVRRKMLELSGPRPIATSSAVTVGFAAIVDLGARHSVSVAIRIFSLTYFARFLNGRNAMKSA